VSDSVEKETAATGPGITPGRLVFMMSFSWLGWSILALVCSYCLNAGIFSDPTLTTPMRWALFCTLGVANALAMTAIGCLADLLRRLFHRRCRWLGTVMICGIVLGFLFGVVASWTAFDSGGTFIDVQGIRFALAFPILIVEHALHQDFIRIVYVVAAFLVASLMLARYGPRVADWLMTSRKLVVSVYTVSIALLAIMVLGAGFGHLRLRHAPQLLDRHPDTGVVSTVGERWRSTWHSRLGPVPALVSTMTFGFGDVQALERLRGLRTSGERIVRPQLVSDSEYLRDADRDSMNRWNVIIVLVESLRKDVLADCGGKHPVMPSLEAVASDSIVYSNVYTQASHSNYADLCIMNSQFPLRSQWEYQVPRSPTYPRTFLHDILGQLGYATAVFSSQDENWGGMIRMLDPGSFDRFFHSGEFGLLSYAPATDDDASRSGRKMKLSGKIDDSLTATEAVKWIADQEKPFFMYMNFQNSHIPYVVPEDHPVQFAPRKLDFVIRLGQFPREKVPIVKGRYWDSLNYLDVQLGKVIEGLKRSGKWDSTLLIVSGDTGQAFYEHGFCSHANQLYDEVMQVPLVVHYPGVKHEVSELSLQHVDVPPMVLSLLGLPPHPGFQGEWAAAAAPRPSPPRFLVAQTTLANQVGVVHEGWKLFFDLDFETFHLYHLETDPAERIDLARQMPQQVSRLGSLLADWVFSQLEYYEDSERHKTEFAPRLVDPDAQ
jgi:arylsulfatase A-like enzyme